MIKDDRVILKFGVLTCLYWFSLYTYVPTLSTYAQSMGASNKLVGLIVGSYGFTQMLIRLPLGIFSDKLNNRKLFVVLGMVFSIVSSMGMWLFKGPEYLLVFRALSGVAASSWVAFTVLFSGYFDQDKTPKAMGIINSYNTLGQLSAMLTGGVVIYFFGESAPFMIALIVGIVGLIFSLKIKEKVIIHREPLKIRELTGLLKNFDFIMCSILAIISQFITFATVFGFTPIIAKKLGAMPFDLNLLSAVSTFPIIISAVLSGSYFTAKIGERNTIIIGFIITAITSSCIPFLSSLPLLYITQFIGGFGRGMTFSLLMGLSIKTVEVKKRATAMGFFQAVYGIGMTVGPAVLGFIGDTLGFNWGFLFTGVVSIIGAIVSLTIGKKSILKEA